MAFEYIELRHIEGGKEMRRDRCCILAVAAGAFGLGALLMIFTAYKLAFIICALLLLTLCKQLMRF